MKRVKRGKKVTHVNQLKIGYLYFEDTMGFVIVDITKGEVTIQSTSNEKTGSIMLEDLKGERERRINKSKRNWEGRRLSEYFL